MKAILFAYRQIKEPLNRVPYGKKAARSASVLPILLIFLTIGNFARCGERQKALPFETAIFREKLSKALLVTSTFDNEFF